MRGTPYIYQGEELGMTNAGFTSTDQYRDVESLHYFDILKESGMEEARIYEVLRQRSRDNSRTPMQWSDQEYAGFTNGVPWIEVNRNYKEINAGECLEDSDSIFYYYQKLVGLRKEYDVISEGGYEPVLEDHEAVFAYKRTYGGDTLLVLTNFTDRSQSIAAADLKLPDEDLTKYRTLIANDGAERESKKIRLSPYGAIMDHKKNSCAVIFSLPT